MNNNKKKNKFTKFRKRTRNRYRERQNYLEQSQQFTKVKINLTQQKKMKTDKDLNNDDVGNC